MKSMNLPRLKTVLLAPIVLFVLFYIVGVIMVLRDDRSVVPLNGVLVEPTTVAIFGASGTAGDGILKAALASADIEKIHVITRRITPRMEEGVKSGKVQLTVHKNYLDYEDIIKQFVEVEAVYWAIGISSVGADEKKYGLIHVDFPMQFVAAWSNVSQVRDISFHFISSSDISEKSTTMWVREKIRAEQSLFAFAEDSKMRVIAYRPDFIGSTKEQSHLGQEILYWFFAPVGAAIRAEQIGQAMIEVSLRWSEFDSGDKLSTAKIIRYSDAYQNRR